MKEWLLDMVKRLPVDLGQGYYRHKTKAKIIAFDAVGQGPGKALDMGCGDGFWSDELKKKKWNVVSVDGFDGRYPGMIKVNAEERLPFNDNEFDLVWMSEVLEHIQNAAGVVAEMRRILKPGGKIVLTTPNSSFWIYDILNWFGLSPKQVQNPDHKQFFDMKQMRELFPKAKIYGFFPYAILKFKISSGIGPLSPTFIVIEENE